MKKIILLALLIKMFSLTATAQGPQNNNSSKKNNKNGSKLGIGFKAGFNFANVTNASSINSGNRTGFMAGAFISPPSKRIISSRTEIIYSRQGYDYRSNTTTGSVNLDYIILPQLMGINITKFVQLQVGGQMAYLLNAKADSTANPSSNNPYAKIMDYYNRFDYGAAAGVEVYPFKGLLIGGRYNISFGNLYKDLTTQSSGEPPSFIPKVNAKNNVVQLFIGYKF
jgi:hypothetical protein